MMLSETIAVVGLLGLKLRATLIKGPLADEAGYVDHPSVGSEYLKKRVRHP